MGGNRMCTAGSTTAMFGGNFDRRGPQWFPLNYMVISALKRYDRFFGDKYVLEFPMGSAQKRRPPTCSISV